MEITRMTDEMKNAITLSFRGETLHLVSDMYSANDQTCLKLETLEGHPYMTCTMNLDDELNDNVVWIKDYSENTGILELLVRRGVLVANGVRQKNGHTEFIQCVIRNEALEQLGMEQAPVSEATEGEDTKVTPPGMGDTGPGVDAETPTADVKETFTFPSKESD